MLKGTPRKHTRYKLIQAALYSRQGLKNTKQTNADICFRVKLIEHINIQNKSWENVDVTKVTLFSLSVSVNWWLNDAHASMQHSTQSEAYKLHIPPLLAPAFLHW